MNYLTDEQAILKANNLDWSKRTTKPNERDKFDFDSATTEELLELYNDQVAKIGNLKALEEDIGFRDDLKMERISKFATLVRMKLIKRDGGRELLDKVKREKKIGKITQEKDNTIAKLSKKIDDLNVEIGKLKDGKKSEIDFYKSEIDRLGEQIKTINEKQRQKIANIELSNKRNHLIYSNFKGLIKNHLGMQVYLEIIQEADRLADLELANNHNK